MGLQGGMLPQLEDDHGLITMNRGWAVNIRYVSKYTKLQFCNECYLFFNPLIIREKYFTEILLNQQPLQKLKNVLERF